MSCLSNAARDKGDLPIDGVTVTVNAGTASPKLVWETRDEFKRCMEEAAATWATLDDPERKAVLRGVTSALERLTLSVDQWVPEGIKRESGNFMEVSFCVLFTDAQTDEGVE